MSNEIIDGSSSSAVTIYNPPPPAVNGIPVVNVVSDNSLSRIRNLPATRRHGINPAIPIAAGAELTLFAAGLILGSIPILVVGGIAIPLVGGAWVVKNVLAAMTHLPSIRPKSDGGLTTQTADSSSRGPMGGGGIGVGVGVGGGLTLGGTTRVDNSTHIHPEIHVLKQPWPFGKVQVEQYTTKGPITHQPEKKKGHKLLAFGLTAIGLTACFGGFALADSFKPPTEGPRSGTRTDSASNQNDSKENNTAAPVFSWKTPSTRKTKNPLPTAPLTNTRQPTLPLEPANGNVPTPPNCQPTSLERAKRLPTPVPDVATKIIETIGGQTFVTYKTAIGKTCYVYTTIDSDQQLAPNKPNTYPATSTPDTAGSDSPQGNASSSCIPKTIAEFRQSEYAKYPYTTNYLSDGRVQFQVEIPDGSIACFTIH